MSKVVTVWLYMTNCYKNEILANFITHTKENIFKMWIFYSHMLEAYLCFAAEGWMEIENEKCMFPVICETACIIYWVHTRQQPRESERLQQACSSINYKHSIFITKIGVNSLTNKKIDHTFFRCHQNLLSIEIWIQKILYSGLQSCNILIILCCLYRCILFSSRTGPLFVHSHGFDGMSHIMKTKHGIIWKYHVSTPIIKLWDYNRVITTSNVIIHILTTGVQTLQSKQVIGQLLGK